MSTTVGFLVSTEFNHGVTLANFQERAAREVLTAIRVPSGPLPTQILLTAPTGSGKTYIAGAIMRSLIPKAPEAPACSIIWASYDPQLNVRSNADFLGVFGMHCNQINAQNPTIAPGLNILDLSKLGAGTKLGTPSEDNSSIPFFERVMSPDNGGRPLYLFVDEAHIGSKQRGAGDQTIVTQLVDAMRRRSAITTASSAIIAITATPDRVLTGLFKGPSTRVKVSRKDVVASGVIKRSVAIPDPRTSIGVGFRSIDVDIAYKKLLEYQLAWDRYAADPTTSTTTAAPIRPLLMVQIPGEKKASTEGPNTPKQWIDSIVAALATRSTPDSHPLTFGYCMSTLVGDQDVETPGGRMRVQQIAAADINKSPINVVFFINGLETGWDCPRAEVLLSFVARTDATTITQILGRVLRNPARPDRLTDAGYEDLDRSFLCVPYYDRDAISDIIKAMEQDASGELTIAVDVHPTQTGVPSAVVTEVLEMLAAVPTDVIAKPGVAGEPRPIARMAKLWEQGGRMAELIATSDAELFRKLGVLVNAARQRSEGLQRFIDGDMNAIQTIVVGDLAENDMDDPESMSVSVAESDVEIVVREVARIFLDSYASKFRHWRTEELRRDNQYSVSDQTTPYAQAGREMAALLTPEGAETASHLFAIHFNDVKNRLVDAGLLPSPAADHLFPKERILGRVGGLPADHPSRHRFRSTSAESTAYRMNLELVESSTARTAADALLAAHLFSPLDGAGLGARPKVIEGELRYVELRMRQGAVLWYRNPERHSGGHPGALAWGYKHLTKDRLFFPDFVFVNMVNGEPHIDIVELHGLEHDMAAKRAAAEVWQMEIDRLPALRGRVTVRVLSTVSAAVGRDVTEMGTVELLANQVRRIVERDSAITSEGVLATLNGDSGWMTNLDAICATPTPDPQVRPRTVSALMALIA